MLSDEFLRGIALVGCAHSAIDSLASQEVAFIGWMVRFREIVEQEGGQKKCRGGKTRSETPYINTRKDTAILSA